MVQNMSKSCYTMLLNQHLCWGRILRPPFPYWEGAPSLCRGDGGGGVLDKKNWVHSPPPLAWCFPIRQKFLQKGDKKCPQFCPNGAMPPNQAARQSRQSSYRKHLTIPRSPNQARTPSSPKGSRVLKYKLLWIPPTLLFIEILFQAIQKKSYNSGGGGWGGPFWEIR